jgi:hypothetical protein
MLYSYAAQNIIKHRKKYIHFLHNKYVNQISYNRQTIQSQQEDITVNFRFNLVFVFLLFHFLKLPERINTVKLSMKKKPWRHQSRDTFPWSIDQEYAICICRDQGDYVCLDRRNARSFYLSYNHNWLLHVSVTWLSTVQHSF